MDPGKCLSLRESQLMHTCTQSVDIADLAQYALKVIGFTLCASVGSFAGLNIDHSSS